MKKWILLTRDNLLEIDQERVREVDSDRPDLPLFVSPALCFHKTFSLPTDLDRSPENLQMEMFTRFLPGNLDEYLIQFVRLEELDEEIRTLGLGVKKELLSGYLDRGAPIYLLERVFAEQKFSLPTLLYIHLYSGSYCGYYEENLRWSRFVSEFDNETEEQTRQYVEENFTGEFEVKELFEERQLKSPESVRGLTEFVAEHNRPEFKLRSESDGDYKQVPLSLWFLLVLALVVTGTWWQSSRLEKNYYQTWMTKRFEQVLDREPRYPLQELEVALKRQKPAAGVKSNVVKKFPLLARIDAAFAQAPVHLLRLNLNGRKVQLIFLTESLKYAENLRSELSKRQMKEVEIVSTEAKELKNYQFEVHLQFQAGGI